MRTLLLTTAFVFAFAALAEAKAPAIQVRGGWTRPVAAGQVAGGYLTLTNRGRSPDRLLAVSSPDAESVRLHQSLMKGDIATMQAVTSLNLAPGQTVRFEPGGYHLMIQGVRREARLGGSLPLVLTFAHAGKVKTSLKVAEQAPKQP